MFLFNNGEPTISFLNPAQIYFKLLPRWSLDAMWSPKMCADGFVKIRFVVKVILNIFASSLNLTVSLRNT